MRAVDYVSIVLKDVRRQRLRSALTIVALTISSVILVTMAAISIGGRRAVVDQLSPDSSLTSIVVTPNQNAGSLGPFGSIQQVNSQASKLDDAAAQQLRGLPYVMQAIPQARIWEFSSFKVEGNDKQFVAQVSGVSDGNSLSLSAGTSFSSTDEGHVVVLGYAYAKALGYSENSQALVGKTVQITTQKGYRGSGADIPPATASAQTNDQFNKTQTTLSATIIGVTKAGNDQTSLFVPLNWAREIRTIYYYDGGGEPKTTDQLAADGYSTITVKAQDAAHVKTVASSIDTLGYGETSTQEQVARLQEFSTIMWVILGSVAIIAAVAAALGVVNTMLMAVSEQRYAIGIWRAFGARKRSIASQFLLEAALLGLVGGLLGSALGVFVSRLVNQHVNTLLSAQDLNLTNIAIVPAWLLLGTIALTTLFSIVAGLYPAWRAARQDPSAALSNGQ
jgi:ABC-type antimicrobial peptide transport system permease subunit